MDVTRMIGVLVALAIGAVLVLTGSATVTEATAYVSAALVYLGVKQGEDQPPRR